MPKLTDFQNSTVIKMLLIGDSGSGKTGSLASLALRGYKLRIIDFDKGIQPLAEAIKKNAKTPEEANAALANVEYVELSDTMSVVAGKLMVKGVPTAIQDAFKLMEKWTPASNKQASDLGSPAQWGRESILVIDSLTHMSNSVMRYIQALSSNSGKNPTQPEWGNAQRIIEEMLTYLYSDDYKTNVIITSHITYIQGEERLDNDGNPAGALKGQPTSLGRALPPKIPSYFNTMLAVEIQGTKRVITTQPNGVINIKNPILMGIPKTLSIETGLADYFDVALGKKSEVSAVTPTSKTTASTTN